MSLIKKPIQVVIIASAILMVMVLGGLIGVSFIMEADIHLWVYIVFPLFVGIVSLLLFYYFIETFINREIKSIYRIISKKKSIKMNPVKLNENVFQSLSETTAAWAETQQKQIETLEEQAKFRREFLGNLAHELKTPVFSIQGYILTLLEGGLEDETVNRSFLKKAMRGVDRITSVLDDLDNISRYEFNRFHLKVTKFDIVNLTREVFDTTHSKAKEKEIKLSLYQNYDPIMVSADKGKIGQVLINLITNSINYGVEKGHTQIKFNKISRKQLMVEVIDDGIGIEEEHFNRLFERFYRVEKSRARNLAGSGLGLPIVKHIMEAHQQTISVNSTVDEGSVFSFTLDLA